MDKEKSFGRKTVDAALIGVSAVTLPFAVWTAGSAFLAGEMLLGTGATIYAASDFTTIKEARSEKKSILNPSWWLDKFSGSKNKATRMEAPQENFFTKVLNSIKGSKRIEHSAQISGYPNRLINLPQAA